ncbi:DUF1835 domain-containing protein [Paenibacillus sp. JJ-223]|uniref:DUF1835 domain-containing protein n=1 Tax=Paenibacillus sp. JJ-223 TaxID=2905647 RepID=UPI001F2E3557|nr:DUF1835 domain-containing protein [Paenibacillus sp. JJ-223]CAH1210579.1 hypothetical protein PAECIP111890_03543 [Paenibacillus sp. JJ-223]
MDELYQKTRKFNVSDYRSLLHRLVDEAQQHVEQGSSEHKVFGEKLYRCIEAQVNAIEQERLQAEQLQTTVHIIFSLSDAGSLKVTLSKLGKRLENRVLAFNDMFSVGPIKDLHTLRGQQARQAWITENDPEHLFSVRHNAANEIGAMMDTLRNIPESKKVIIWCADNAHDQTGLRFALYVLRERKNVIHIANVTHACKEMGTNWGEEAAPYAAAHIERDTYVEMVKNYGEGYALNRAERIALEAEWEELAGQDHILRLWKNGSIIGCEEEDLDDVIVSSMVELQRHQENSGAFVEAADLVIHVLNSIRQRVTLTFITHRIWKLVSEGVFVFRGMPGQLHQFSLRLMGEK